MKITDKISQKEVKILAKAGQTFVQETMSEGDDMASTLFLMHEKIKIFQIALISIMATVRKKECVASFYSDIVEMCSSGLDIIMEHPEILERTPIPPSFSDGDSAVPEIIKLLEEIKSFKRKTT